MAESRSHDLVLQVMGYHQATKHHFYRYAKSPGYMDWANQPNPFRRYEGARLSRLPLLGPDDEPTSPSYDAIFHRGRVTSQPVTLRIISRFLEYALAVSAWKEAGGMRWALRSNPSSGNLHPTEGYLLLPEISGLAMSPALYHYAPKEHGLEHRAEWPKEMFASMMQGFPPQAFLFGLSSVHWREAWKYGERAFRYCQHDVGHAIGAARLAAATLGWNMMILDDLGDDEVAALLGIGRDGDYKGAEREHPDCLCVIWPDMPVAPLHLPLKLPGDLLKDAEQIVWHGTANRLSRDKPEPWDMIDVVAAATAKPSHQPRIIDWSLGKSSPAVGQGKTLDTPNRAPAGRLIRQRRSAVAFDGQTPILAQQFFHILSRVMPHSHQDLGSRPAPWDAIPWSPAIHLVLFVHRVQGIPPGLYVLVRHPDAVNSLRRAMHEYFLWTRPPDCPDELPLFLLAEGEAKQLAIQVSCHQDIAGDSAFALGMIAEFEPTLRRYGAWFYRRLFWETGVIGQVLYLEAEAIGIRSTGIGCFFDDPVHQVFGLRDNLFQSLYHFTMGGPVEDTRLTTLPPYEKVNGEEQTG